MKVVQELVETSLATRQEVNLKLRWPVKRMVIVSKEKIVIDAVKNLKNILKKISNVKEVEVSSKKPSGELAEGEFENGKLFLDLSEDQALMEERLYRELTRTVQSMRKKKGLIVNDRIKLTLKSDSETEKILKKFVDVLKKDVGASQVDVGKSEGSSEGKLKFKNKVVEVRF